MLDWKAVSQFCIYRARWKGRSFSPQSPLRGMGGICKGCKCHARQKQQTRAPPHSTPAHTTATTTTTTATKTTTITATTATATTTTRTRTRTSNKNKNKHQNDNNHNHNPQPTTTNNQQQLANTMRNGQFQLQNAAYCILYAIRRFQLQSASTSMENGSLQSQSVANSMQNRRFQLPNVPNSMHAGRLQV